MQGYNKNNKLDPTALMLGYNKLDVTVLMQGYNKNNKLDTTVLMQGFK